MRKYRVCGIKEDGQMTAWVTCESREEQIAKANALLAQDGIVAIKTCSVETL